jgi:hypothetical protein
MFLKRTTGPAGTDCSSATNRDVTKPAKKSNCISVDKVGQ